MRRRLRDSTWAHTPRSRWSGRIGSGSCGALAILRGAECRPARTRRSCPTTTPTTGAVPGPGTRSSATQDSRTCLCLGGDPGPHRLLPRPVVVVDGGDDDQVWGWCPPASTPAKVCVGTRDVPPVKGAGRVLGDGVHREEARAGKHLVGREHVTGDCSGLPYDHRDHKLAPVGHVANLRHGSGRITGGGV